MASVDTICDALRGGIRLSPGAHVSLYALVRRWRLQLCPRSGGRNELVGECIYYDDAVPIGEQEYHIARCAVAWALVAMGLIAEASPHTIALALCGVKAPPPARVETPPAPRRPAVVVRLRPRS